MRHFFAALMLASASAFAGQVQVTDDASVIPSGQVLKLITDGSRWPFDLRVLVRSFPDRGSLDGAASRGVTTPNTIAVVVDPVHHSTRVHFGTATGVRSFDYNLIGLAGGTYFKSGDWAGGVEAIADRAHQSIQSGRSITMVVHNSPGSVQIAGAQNVVLQGGEHRVVSFDQPAPIVMERHFVSQPSAPIQPVIVTQSSSAGWWWLIGAIMLVAGVWISIELLRRQKRLDKDMASFREERDEYLNANVDRMVSRDPSPKRAAPSPPRTPRVVTSLAPYNVPVRPTVMPGGPAKSAPTQQQQQQVVVQNNQSDFVTGLVVGEALARPAVREREVIVERVEEHHSRSSDDGGGGGGDWGSSSDSSSSIDAGGGGGGWDSGGSNDGGGGGGDW